MCNLNGMKIIAPVKGRGKDNDVVITTATAHGHKGVRISLSASALATLDNAERVIFGIHDGYRNRLYIFDNRKAPNIVGYKLTKSGERKCVRIDERSISAYGFNMNSLIGHYKLDRDQHNDTYVALSTNV